MNESELYKELGELTKDRDRWKESVPHVSALLAHDSEKIKAKALWVLGEIGLAYPLSVQGVVPVIASFLKSPAPLLRKRAVNALGRIGRGGYHVIEPYWKDLFRFTADEDPGVRLSFIWASENIAVNTPDVYEHFLPVFAELLYDEDDKVRMEAPEIFRVLGKRRPEFVRPFVGQLRKIAETDGNRVVRIHCTGAVETIESRRARRDQLRDGKKDRQVILLNGPSSSGKTTLAKALQALILEKRDEEYEIVSIDDFLEMSPTETIYEDDVFRISDDICSRALGVLRTGAGVIIEHVITSERIFVRLQEALSPWRIRMVRVACPLRVLRRRELARGDRCPGSAEASAEYLFPKEGYELVVDTEANSPQENALRIFERFF